jgi:hypothetical protein
MLQTYLINILIFCGILLLIALIVAVVLVILSLAEIRHMVRDAKHKFYTMTSVVDIVALLLGGAGGAGQRLKKKLVSEKSTLTAFLAGLKKALQVLFRDK